MRALYLISFCVFASFASATQAAISLNTDDIWLRESVPGAENGAGFGALLNPSNEDVVIVGAYSEVAGDVEIHQHVSRNGQMSMEAIEALTVPAGEEVKLQPGGYHLMLLGLKQRLTTGDEHEITLLLASGEAITMMAEVKPLIEDAHNEHH
ncbi:hypothetical protein CWE09_10320 [Aliidiomarina minuta]|uniref:Copper chaperone PCu(A)C n=1 Tax=Aliidiomarina minuta TaxID=880057 RepID=A0A432W458_9GAMM|nr:copper chaperone PCu(A)C [Aliidiomarina minuta]RUO24266.1 hypothetical protein CWE09_10320 [Aliidiomarina minuta]